MSQRMLKSVLAELPASSVEIEKSHANVQRDASEDRGTRPNAFTIQRNSYLLSALLEHANRLGAVEDECLGTERKKVLRIARSRVVDSSAPAAGLSLAKADRRKLNPDGTVKRKRGLLKGLLCLGCAHQVSNDVF